MKITLLGTGTSSGVPQIGCQCRVCLSDDIRDKRLRTSALIETDSCRLLVDCGPDFRQQILKLPFKPIDAVLLTHEHYDHIGGLDDLRPFSEQARLDVFGLERTLNVVRRQMPYSLDTVERPRVPHLKLNAVEAGRPFLVERSGGEPLSVMPIEVLHGEMPILGYRIGKMAFITDMKSAPEESLKLLEGVECLIINGLRHRMHTTHQTIEDAVSLSQKLGASCVRIIHLAHSAGLHAESATYLPPHIKFGYDGEVLYVED